MSSTRPFKPRHTANILGAVLGVGIVLSAGHGQSESCSVSAVHAGLVFPVQQIDPDKACMLQAIIRDHTTESRVGPVRAALAESMYRYLLDHPPFTATLIRRLKLGLYESDVRGPGRFWGDDGEGTKGIVELVYEDPTSRVYYLEGSHESRLLPHITGKAVVFLRTDVVRNANSEDMIDSTLVAYTRLDNRLLSGLVYVLHPLVTRVVKSRLQKGMETVNRLGVAMRRDPQRLLLVASDPPPLPEHHMAFLKKTLIGAHDVDKAIPRDRSLP